VGWGNNDDAQINSALSAIRSITYGSIPCGGLGGSPTDALDAEAAGGSILRYDIAANQYIYNWAAPAQAGCYVLVLTFDTGQSFTALFDLK
jgi:hypothetical protein